MAFKFHKSLKGAGMPPLLRVIIDNSDTITEGDAVKSYNAGNVEVATAARPILGFVHTVVSKTGLRPAPDSGTDDTWTVESDNETDKQLAALVDSDQDSIYSGAQDGTVGTTSDSEKIGISIDLVSESSLNETSAVRNGQGQLFGHGADPADSTRILVSIMESEKRAGASYS